MAEQKRFLRNIQGDVWPRLPKKAETFYFFTIVDVPKFKTQLVKFIPMITTGAEAMSVRSDLYKRKAKGQKSLIQLSSINISFSHSGLTKLGKADVGDDVFSGGQYKDMVTGGLDDPQDWDKVWTGYNGSIDGVFIIAGNSLAYVDDTFFGTVQPTFSEGGPTTGMKIVHTESGTVQQADKEHFGWVDGISEPLVKGLEEKTKEKDLDPVPAGVFFMGGEEDYTNSPAWAKDSSFMVFRRLRQLVPEFTMWCAMNAGSMDFDVIRLFSSRVVGRWPDGAPIDKYPTHAPHDGDDEHPVQKENDFDFGPDVHKQARCPFASHIRKVRPRKDFPDDSNAMIRRGIPYGEWTNVEEKRGGSSLKNRGLLFVSYQASLRGGFRFVMKEWANKDGFPDDKFEACGGQGPGIDPIIGQVRKYPGKANIPDAKDLKEAGDINTRYVDVQKFVIPEGGEYFFTPSISALKDTLCK